MLELFRLDAEGQLQALTAALLALERTPDAPEQLEACMRAAHSLKGAARIVGLDTAVALAHAMEDSFVAAQRGQLRLRRAQIDGLLQGVDLLQRMAHAQDAELVAGGALAAETDRYLVQLAGLLDGSAANEAQAAPEPAAAAAPPAAAPLPQAETTETGERVLRVTADRLNRLLGVAGESLVESRWLKPFADSLLRLKRLHEEAGRTLERLQESLSKATLAERTQAQLGELQQHMLGFRRQLAERLVELEMYDRRSTTLAHRLYEEALACRMRPFADGLRGYPRMVRDLARQLGKQVRLEIVGEDTRVDRDILEKLDAPLGHLLRNALDHGIETPAERLMAGKLPEGLLHLEARHSGGMLQIIVADDGRGIDPERLRERVVQRRLTTADVAAQLSEAELLEFLFLPGFTLRDQVTEVSGRGVGLDVVQTMLKDVRGSVRVIPAPGQGARFQLQLPLSLSVVRTLLADVGGETYALPLAYIGRTLKLPRSEIELLENRQLFRLDGRTVGLVSARQLLHGGEATPAGDELAVILLGEGEQRYGLVVDRFLGERELVVQALDPRLGKLKDIAAAALMEDGSPVLIVDIDDLMRSVEKLASTGRLSQVQRRDEERRQRKRVLVVDDSLTVRELERKLLDTVGYDVDIAVDGMDAWNAVRTGRYDLVVTDVDMPRMDGIELVSLVKKDPQLKALPVMIVTYKDREEDRRRGLEAGADYYLTKGSFHDETLLQAVADLIGEA